MSGKLDSISLSNILNDLRHIIDTARNNAVRSVDFCRVRMYWELGQRIVEEEQQGLARAQYGSYLLKNLAHKLEGEYGSGFSLRQLERARQFYRAYPIASALRSQLNWSQYKMLISIEDKDNIVMVVASQYRANGFRHQWLYQPLSGFYRADALREDCHHRDQGRPSGQ